MPTTERRGRDGGPAAPGPPYGEAAPCGTAAAKALPYRSNAARRPWLPPACPVTRPGRPELRKPMSVSEEISREHDPGAV
ncbi:MAG: hypothetical protein R6V12_13055, partial [Candidatus Hydrogenedentota bacterium]